MHTKHPVALMTVLFLSFAWKQQSTHGIRGSRRKQLAALVSVLSRDRKQVQWSSSICVKQLLWVNQSSKN